MSKNRLHPAAIFLNLASVLKSYYIAIILGLITFRGQSLLYFILIVLAVLAIFLIFSILTWYRFTYKVEDEELHIEYGIFVRKQRYISKNRIQSIDLTATVVHRMFKLVKVQVDTAGSGAGAEASLSAVKLSVGEQLRSELTTKDQVEIEQEIKDPQIAEYKITFKRLFLAGSTSGSIGVMLGILFFGLSEVEQYIPNHVYDLTYEWIIGLSILILIGIALLILFILWLLGIAGTMIKYGNFTISRRDDELFITRGLLEKREQTIPIKRIQAVGIEESIIRQPFGYVTVFAEIAGGSLDKNEEFNILFPMMKKKEVEHFLQSLLPTHSKLAEQFQPLPKRAAKFYFFRSVFPILLLGIGVWYVFPQFSWIVAILLLASVLLGLLRYRDGGYSIKENRLTIRYRGLLTKKTVHMYKNRIQAFEKKQHKVQQIQQLATMRISIIGVLGLGTHYVIKDMNETDVKHLADWYSHEISNEQLYD